MPLEFDNYSVKTHTITLTQNELILLRNEYRQNIEWFVNGTERNYGLLREELSSLRQRIDNVFYNEKGEYHVSTSFGSPSDAYKYFYVCEPNQNSPLTIDDNTKNPFSVLKEQLDILRVWTAEEVLIVLTNSDRIASFIDECIVPSEPSDKSFDIILTKWIDFLPENRFTVMCLNGNVVAIIPHHKFNKNIDKELIKSMAETVNKNIIKDEVFDVVIFESKIIVLSTTTNTFNFGPY